MAQTVSYDASRAHTAATACPLDCPDACSLDVTSVDGRVVKIDGSRRHEVTNGYICAKVRDFGGRVHGDARLLYPAVRVGPKGEGRFERVSWDRALDLIAERMVEARDRWGAESILPFYYGGSNGYVTQDYADARLFRRLGASRLARTVCAAPTGAANAALYGKMPGVTYQDYPSARMIVLWGVNPSASGIHLVPYIREAQRNGARLVVVDPRATPLARTADLHLAVRPGTDVCVALAVHRHLFESGAADLDFLAAHTTGWERLRERAAEWTFERAAEVAGIDAGDLARFAEEYAAASPALVRCGWGLERNRNGGNAAMSVLALPAVGGKFGVRGGGHSMSNSGAWPLADAQRRWTGAEEPGTRSINMNHLARVLADLDDPPIKVLFVYNCNPVATMPDQRRVVEGLEREDLFTVVFEQVATDTVPYADVVLPATTFLEHHDTAKGYGAISLQHVSPVIPRVGEALPNAEVFDDLLDRLGLKTDEEYAARGEFDRSGGDAADYALAVRAMPDPIRDTLESRGIAEPPFGGAPVQFVDVFPRTDDGRVHLFDEALEASSPSGLYRFQADPATDAYPLALISPASSRTISSTLGELVERKAALRMNPRDAAARALADGQRVRVFNELGEVVCALGVDDRMREGTVCLLKGLWRKHTENGLTSNALSPDTLSDLGAGACFNDARVQVRAV